MLQATLSIARFLRRASLKPSGFKMADWRSRLITTVTKAHEYMACSLRNISRRQAASPASHCTVTFHAASTGITISVTSRSAAVRCRMSTRTCELRLWPLAAHSTPTLQSVDAAHRMEVRTTRTRAAVEKVGSWRSAAEASPGGPEETGPGMGPEVGGRPGGGGGENTEAGVRSAERVAFMAGSRGRGSCPHSR